VRRLAILDSSGVELTIFVVIHSRPCENLLGLRCLRRPRRGLLVARQAQTNAPREIGYDELLSLLEKPQAVVFIDVREPNEIAVTGPQRRIDHSARTTRRPAQRRAKDKLLVPFCKRGGRAGKAATLLDGRGYTTIGSSSGNLLREAEEIHRLPK